MEGVAPELLQELVPAGVLRAAINFGNPTLAQRPADGGYPRGVSADLAQELGRWLGVPVAFVTFDSAGKVIDAVPTGTLDVVFLASDPARAGSVLFTAPYVIIEGTYMVRESSPLRAVADLDRPGVRIAVGRGAAYDLFLTRTLEHAELVRAETSAEAMNLFAAAGLEAAAGVRRTLQDHATTHPGFRVMDGSFQVIEQAMGTPAGRPLARAYLQAFVETMKASGFVQRSLENSGQNQARVAPPQASWPGF
jgi:polar amino acid transport system substrate-binding protein